VKSVEPHSQSSEQATMSAKSAINKEIFTPHDERMLAAVQVKRRTKKKLPFLATGGQGDYSTFICLSGILCSGLYRTVYVKLQWMSRPFHRNFTRELAVNIPLPPPSWTQSKVHAQFQMGLAYASLPGGNEQQIAQQRLARSSVASPSPASPAPSLRKAERTRSCDARRRQAVTATERVTSCFLHSLIPVTNRKPTQVSITKVKQFEGSSSFIRRSQWTLDQLRQVNGIDPNRDGPEFDLTFENAFDQWVASSAGDKCMFVQVLHHTCQRYSADRKPEFVNCQSKLLGGNSILHSAADSVTSAVQKASQALNERGERLGRVEERTGDLMNSAQQFADTAHKLAMKHKC
ncbi:hypothetical protein P4O66_011662, partial [Electrophorus voltai]